MQKVFNLTNKYIILLTPLILYSLFSTLYLIITASSNRLLNLIFAIFLFLLMTGAFISGWFNMIKNAIIYQERVDYNSLIKDFPSGVGEYFLTSLGAIVLIFTLILASIICSYYIGINTIGNPNVPLENLIKAFQDTATLKNFVSELTIEQISKLNLWNILILSSVSLIYFLSMLFFPTIFFKNKNPIKAFFISLKNTFSKKIFKTVGIFLIIYVANFIISLLLAIFSNNMFLHFLTTLLNFYFITIASVGIFYYYYTNFINSDIGQNIDVRI